MKKIISFIFALTLTSACLTNFTFAADTENSLYSTNIASDIVNFQKWLINSEDSFSFQDNELHINKELDVFDLCQMRYAILEQDSEIDLTDTPIIYNVCTDIKVESPEKKMLDEKFINGQMNFAVELFKNATDENESSLISPYSVMQALAMTTNGAKGKTLEEMEEALGGVDINDLNSYLVSFDSQLRKSVVMRNVNSIWAVKDLERMSPKKSFLRKMVKYYDADFFLAPFDNNTLDELNKYVSDNTDGCIPNALDSINPDDTMYLINSVIFNAEWSKRYYGEYKPYYTFTDVYGNEQPCALMGSWEKYIGDENTDGFVKTYKHTDIAFAALLPHESVDINDYIDNLTGEKLNNLLTQESNEQALCKLLKFGFRYENNLKDELKAMGINEAFEKDADFTNLTLADSPTYINDVSHVTYVNVNEEGTFAGAGTIVSITAGSGMPEKRVILDRPFVYCIFDTNTGIPLYIGTIMSMDDTE